MDWLGSVADVLGVVSAVTVFVGWLVARRERVRARLFRWKRRWFQRDRPEIYRFGDDSDQRFT